MRKVLYVLHLNKDDKYRHEGLLSGAKGLYLLHAAGYIF